MTPRNQLREKAEAAKLVGMELAAGANLDRVAAGKIAMLLALLTSPDGVATIDDATEDLTEGFRDGGRWRGTVCRSLAMAHIIESVGVDKSTRPSRHRGYVTRWRLVNRHKATLLLTSLVASLDRLPTRWQKTKPRRAPLLRNWPPRLRFNQSSPNSRKGFPMGKLSDILAAGGLSGKDFAETWQKTEAAGERTPIPAGEYVCYADRGEPKTASTGTPCYALTFKVIEGEHAGRLLWLDCWLTPAAMAMTKRDLVKLGIDSPEKLEQPLPQGIRCEVRVAVRKGDDGVERNRVARFRVLCIDKIEPDAFAPADSLPQTEGGTDEF